MRMGSVTHNFDMDQRFMNLTFRPGSGAGTLDVDAPANPNVAPPGRYMLFLIDDKGVPSVASLLQVQNGTADTQPPTQPGGPTASVSGADVSLSWSAASDDRGVTEYRVHRSTTSGFTPSAANRIATVTSGTTYSDRGLAPGNYFYAVVAADAAGNLSPASREEPATVQPDTTAPTVSIGARHGRRHGLRHDRRERQRVRRPRRELGPVPARRREPRRGRHERALLHELGHRRRGQRQPPAHGRGP